MSGIDKLTTVKLVIEYNGAGFCGWQEQPGLRSIQGELSRVLSTVLRGPVLEVTASGRTDSGVHARAQVVSFKTHSDLGGIDRLPFSVTSLLRGEVSVLEASVVPDDFNARFSKHTKQYSYRIFTRRSAPILEASFVWHESRCTNLAAMRKAAESLIGRHDFTSLRSSDCTARSPVRLILESELIENGDELIYRVVAPGFLKQMVRNIVGTLVGIGMNRLEGRTMPEILLARDRKKAGMTAPAQGLRLDWVKYE